MYNQDNDYLQGRLDAYELMVELLKSYPTRTVVKIIEARIEEMREENRNAQEV